MKREHLALPWWGAAVLTLVCAVVHRVAHDVTAHYVARWLAR